MGEVDCMSLRFTICIPVRNSLKTLPRCLESIRSQNFFDYEIVIVDNGSDEETICYLQAIEDDRIHVIYQENEGLYLSRKKAMETAKGDYLFFLDSDDYLEQGILEKLSAVVDQTQADVLLLTTSLIGQSMEKQIRYPFVPNVKMELKQEMIQDFLSEPLFNNLWNKVIKRGVLTGKHTYHLTCVEGMLYLLELLEKHFSFVNCADLHYLYSVNDGSAIRAYNKNFSNEFEIVMDEYLKFVQKLQRPDLKEEKAASFYFMLFTHICSIGYGFNGKESYRKMKTLRKSSGVRKLYASFKMKGLSRSRRGVLILFKAKFFRCIHLICKLKKRGRV